MATNYKLCLIKNVFLEEELTTCIIQLIFIIKFRSRQLSIFNKRFSLVLLFTLQGFTKSASLYFSHSMRSICSSYPLLPCAFDISRRLRRHSFQKYQLILRTFIAIDYLELACGIRSDGWALSRQKLASSQVHEQQIRSKNLRNFLQIC